MGILNLVEEIAGAVAADKALEAVDPNAGFLEKAAAAVAGFKGVEAIQDHFEEANEEKNEDEDKSADNDADNS